MGKIENNAFNFPHFFWFYTKSILLLFSHNALVLLFENLPILGSFGMQTI